MASIDQQDHGGTVSIVAIYSIPLLFARATTAIRSVATAGVADMIGKCFYCEESSDEECFYCQEVEE